MLKFAATKPISNFFLFWALSLLTIYFRQNFHSSEVQIITTAISSLILFGYSMLWPFGVYKYLVGKEGGKPEFPRFNIDNFVLLATGLFCVWFTIEETFPNLAEGIAYYVVGAPITVFWLIVYVVLNWRASNMLDNLYARKYGNLFHIPSFFGFLIWPAGGIFFVGDRLLRLTSGQAR